MSETIKVLVVGAGNMGRSHALAYASIPEFELAAVCTRKPESRAALMANSQRELRRSMIMGKPCRN